MLVDLHKYRKEWFGNVRADALSGIVVAIALIPESVAFSLLAGLSPMVGLYASVCIAIVTAFTGARPGMISAATGAMALILIDLVKDYGLEYMLAATILAGGIQMILGAGKIGKLIRFIPKPVMLGFVNALAIMIFKSQLTYFSDGSIVMVALVAVGVAIICIFPFMNKTIPAPIIAIIAITAFVIITGTSVTTIGDIGNISSSFPTLALPNIPFTFETLLIILPYSLSLAIVGLVESMLTAKLLDDLTDSNSNKNVECASQGLGNMVSGFFGGMAGGAMIGQTMINFKSGGRGRLSVFVAGIFLMILILFLADYVSLIPMAVLVAVMIVVSASTFSWKSLKRMKVVPLADTFVMVSTIAIVLLTDNLALGVIGGIIFSALFFVNKISNTTVDVVEEDGVTTYVCKGQLFFASTTRFIEKFDLHAHDCKVIIDISNMQVWDDSAVDTFDTIIRKYKIRNVDLQIVGLDKSSENLINRLSENNMAFSKNI